MIYQTEGYIVLEGKRDEICDLNFDDVGRTKNA
jgi:hypothetical protein